jgi:hypothetical protein
MTHAFAWPSGNPAQFRKLLRYFTEFGGVWFPTHRELVKHFADPNIEKTPYSQRFFAYSPINPAFEPSLNAQSARVAFGEPRP